MGTDFSYGDVIGFRVRDWSHRLLKEEEVDGQICYVVESLPKNAAVRDANGYTKRVSWIRKDNFVMIRGETWGMTEEPLKSFRFSDVRQVDAANGKWQAMRMEAENIENGHRSVIQLEDFKSNQGIRDDLFTPHALEKEE
jgi:hypothetical protein